MYGYTIFHEDILKTLIDSVRDGRNANTYIFEGGKELGVENAAMLFASALLCMNSKNAPCGSCGPCMETSSGANPDLIHLSKQKDKATIGVDLVRDVVLSSAIEKPIYSKRKVFIINDGDILTAGAQNAMLKMLEEPPEYAVFIIICENSMSILETVRSRSVIVAFRPVSDNIVRKYITEKYPDIDGLDFLVRFCAGMPMVADKIAEREDFGELREETLNLVPKLLTSNKFHSFAFAEYFDKHKDNAVEICDLILMYLRDALVTSMGGYDIINIDKREKINILASKYSARIITEGADEMITAKKMIQKYVKPSAAAMHASLSVG